MKYSILILAVCIVALAALFWRANQPGEKTQALVLKSVATNISGLTPAQPAVKAGEYFGPPQPLLTDYAQINFAGAMQPIAVDWFDKGKLDIIVGGCSGKVWLYERIGGSAKAPAFAPAKVIGSIPCYISRPLAFDWNRDGLKDLLVAGYYTGIYLLKNVGTNQKPVLEFAGLLKDENGLVFSIEYHHPEHQLDDQGGYVDERFHNFLCPAVCDWFGDGGDDLLIGDQTGVIWILEDVSQGKGPPRYQGEKYRKSERRRKQGPGVNNYGVTLFIEKYGEYYSRPTQRLHYADGKEIRVGSEEDEKSRKIFQGSSAKPVVCDWDGDGDRDLIVASGSGKQNIEFIENVGRNKNGQPQLINRGPVSSDKGLVTESLYCRCIVADWDNDGYLDLIVGGYSVLEYYQNIKKAKGIPVLTYGGPFCASNTVLAADDNIGGAPDWDGDGRPDLLEGNFGGSVTIRRNTGSLQQISFSTKTVPLCDEQGPIRVPGETDSKWKETGGVSKPVLFDWNNDGVLDLIIGADTGNIHYYQGISAKGKSIPQKFRNMGKLKDRTGKVIKVHNRAAVQVVDLNGDGRSDLLAAGTTYQMGFKTDDNVGGDVQMFVNIGTNPDGTPILAPGCVFETDGKPLVFPPNQNCLLNKGDIDRDGKEEIIFCVNNMGTRLIRNIGTANKPSWILAEKLEGLAFYNFVDINGDSWPDAIFGGGEYSAGIYRLNKENMQ